MPADVIQPIIVGSGLLIGNITVMTSEFQRQTRGAYAISGVPLIPNADITFQPPNLNTVYSEYDNRFNHPTYYST